MKVSIIVPVLNEEENIERLIKRLCKGNTDKIAELLVVDGGSTDRTLDLAAYAGAQILRSPKKGRAQQMNFGAQHATGDLLYFVHGDTLPPERYLDDLYQAVNEGFVIGSFRLLLDSKNPFLKINSFMTRFPFLWCRGGDQTLFVTRNFFWELGGYREEYCIMEEYDLIVRAKEKHPFKIIPRNVLASARKYAVNGYFRVQFANFLVFNMFRFGASQQLMLKTYQKLLNWR